MSYEISYLGVGGLTLEGYRRIMLNRPVLWPVGRSTGEWEGVNSDSRDGQVP